MLCLVSVEVSLPRGSLVTPMMDSQYLQIDASSVSLNLSWFCRLALKSLAHSLRIRIGDMPQSVFDISAACCRCMAQDPEGPVLLAEVYAACSSDSKAEKALKVKVAEAMGNADGPSVCEFLNSLGEDEMKKLFSRDLIPSAGSCMFVEKILASVPPTLWPECALDWGRTSTFFSLQFNTSMACMP
jgi:hypothetical protein